MVSFVTGGVPVASEDLLAIYDDMSSTYNSGIFYSLVHRGLTVIQQGIADDWVLFYHRIFLFTQLIGFPEQVIGQFRMGCVYGTSGQILAAGFEKRRRKNTGSFGKSPAFHC